MKKEKNIIQFTSYSLPHVWGVENVVEGVFLKWTHWKSSIFSWDKKQNNIVYNDIMHRNIDTKERIYFPSFDIIDNFSFPRLWTILFWKQLTRLKKVIQNHSNQTFILTHTRFFFSSFLGWVFAKYYKIPWFHIEHGSDYIQLRSSFFTKVAYIYDRILWKWVLRNAQKVLCISEASKIFIEKEFQVKDVSVWYRGIDFPLSEISKNHEDIELVFIGRLVSLKWVKYLLEAYKRLNIALTLTIIGDGPERSSLETLSQNRNIIFLWAQEKTFIMDFLTQRNCILVNPSSQEWMPTTVIEALMTKNVVIATDVWGTKEISNEQDLILFPPWDIDALVEKIIFAKENYFLFQSKSYNHMRDTFSWEKSLENLYNFLYLWNEKQ